MDIPAKVAYEWVLVMSKGDDIILSENQYAFYKEHYEDNKIFFEDVELNPGFVVSATKRPAIFIRNKYPCRPCHQGGYNKTQTGWCENCGGSGVDLPKKP